MRPLALGYLRHHEADPPEVAAVLTAQLHAYAEQEGLTLAEIYTDLFDPPANRPSRPAFCALMDALRRHETPAVIIPTRAHLARQADGFTARRTIIETEAGARLILIDPTSRRRSATSR